jgi:GNAT superfamily N-acetyltransferase
MPSAIAIEVAMRLDADAISLLINGLAKHFTQDPDGRGAEAFLQTIRPAAIAALMEAPNMLYCKAVVGGRLAGVVALRDNTHLFHLFVDPAFQGQGLSRKLWLHAKTIALSRGHAGPFTVNSTPSAVPVYRRFGFVAAGPQVDKNGISFVPMRSS